MMLPARTPGWRSLLYAWTLSIAELPHDYGQHDCALFTAGGIDAMHGTDLARQWRGRYSTLAGGLRVLRKAGYRDNLDMLAQMARPVEPAHAQIGDIAVVAAGDGVATGFVLGESIQLLHLNGLMAIPTMALIDGALVRAAREVWRT